MAKTEIILPPSADYALRVKHRFDKVGDFQWYWLQSDLHWDSPEWQRKLYHKHAKQAKERNALFVDLGDIFDVISGRGDRRGTKGTFRPEHKEDAYLDRVVKDAADEFGEYADNFLVLGTGNHESKLLKICETDLTTRLIEKLNAKRSKSLTPIHRAGYDFWISIATDYQGRRDTKVIKCHHGHGGGGEVTKGVIQDQRASASTEGYDAYVHGHVHERYILPEMVECLSGNDRNGNLKILARERTHIRLGSYKSDFRTDGSATWHMERGGRVKPLGGAFIKIEQTNNSLVQLSVELPVIDYNSLA